MSSARDFAQVGGLAVALVLVGSIGFQFQTKPTPVQSRVRSTMEVALASAPRDSFIEYRGGLLVKIIDNNPTMELLYVMPPVGHSYQTIYSEKLDSIARVIKPDYATYTDASRRYADQQNYH